MIRQGIPRSGDKGELMTCLLVLACLSLIQLERPVLERGGESDSPPSHLPAAIDIVAALENVVADAIARAEPSVVAIHRVKGENQQETLAVRGKPRPLAFDSRLPRSRQRQCGRRLPS